MAQPRWTLAVQHAGGNIAMAAYDSVSMLSSHCDGVLSHACAARLCHRQQGRSAPQLSRYLLAALLQGATGIDEAEGEVPLQPQQRPIVLLHDTALDTLLTLLHLACSADNVQGVRRSGQLA